MSLALIPNDTEMSVFKIMSQQAVDSKMYRSIGDQAGIMMIMLAARELGIPPVQALNGGIHIIQGKVEISARMMNAMIRKNGHSIKVKELKDDTCVLVGRRCDNDDNFCVTYTIEDAKKAGLVKPNSGWTKYPQDMLFARALSRLARQLFPDVVGSGYVEGEISEQKDTKISVSVPDNTLTISAEVEVVNEQKNDEKNDNLSDKYYSIFDNQNIHAATAYLDVVMKHFDWTMERTITEFLKNPEETKEKFLKWKNRGKDEKSKPIDGN